MSELQIVNRETEEVVGSYDTTGRTDRQVERLERGMSINLDHDRFYIKQVEV